MPTPDPLMVTLRVMRKRQGLTGEACSRKLGFSNSVVYMYESGRRMPPLVEARRYAALLGYDIALLPLAAEEAVT